MYTKGNGNMSRVSSEVAIRERHIVSPTRRDRKTGKGRFKHFIDECNLRLDRPTAERSESRDKNDYSQRSLMGGAAASNLSAPSYYRETPSKSSVASLLQSPYQGSSIGVNRRDQEVSVLPGSALTTSVCSHFMRSSCREGLSCKFLHPASSELDRRLNNNVRK